MFTYFYNMLKILVVKMHKRDIYIFLFCLNAGPPCASVFLERKLQVLCRVCCVCAHVGESFLYTCRSKDLSIQNPCGTFSTPKVLHRSSKIHFPFKDERAVWPVHVNTALCARLRVPQRRESTGTSLDYAGREGGQR